MRRLCLFAVVAALALPRISDAACTKCLAKEIVTTTDATKYLIGGTDAAGGMGDWYLTNKKIEAVIDDVGKISIDVAGGGTVQVDQTSSNAVATGGTLVDVGLYKKNNDQLPQSFSVGGLSLANVMLFRPGDETIWSVPAGNNPCPSMDGSGPAACQSDANCASITVFGIMLLPTVSSYSTPTLWVRNRYQACDGQQQLQIRTEVWNQSAGSIGNLPVIDVFLWGGRGLDAFVPYPGRGFNHTILDLADALLLVINTPYWFAPGNVSKADGKMSRAKSANEVSYGYVTGIGPVPSGQNDPDGPGPSPPVTIPFVQQHALAGLHGNLLSAAILPVYLGGNPVAAGTSRIFNRSLVIGRKNDGNSVTGDPKNPSSIFAQLGYPRGSFSGSVSPGSKEEGTITFIRAAGSPALSPPISDNSPVTSVRAKGGFKVYLPIGDYYARGVFPGRPDFVEGPFTIAANVNTKISFTNPFPKVGTITGMIVDADTNFGIPAKLSFSPSPVFRRDFEAMSFTNALGMCSNNFNTTCTADAPCGGGNTCFRVCSNEEPTRCQVTADCNVGDGEVCASDKRCRSHGCDTDGDCEPGNRCVGDTSSIVPEGYPGGAAQLNVIYTENGKIKQRVKPGSYTITISRGPEFTIQETTVNVTAGVTTALNGGSPISLKRVVDTTGWQSADFHIHSGRSLDSSAPLEARVRSFAAEGVDVMVSTDHDIVTDYTPAIKKLKLGSFINSIIGTEVTTSVGTPPYFSNSWGHMNAWPQLYNPNIRRGGSVEDENVSPNVVYDRIRSALGPTNMQCIGGTTAGIVCTTSSQCKGGGVCTDVGNPVIQLNHVRAGVSGVVNIGFFDNIGYNPAALVNDCQKYPVICPSSECFGGTNDGTACTTNAACTGGGVCGCVSASVPAMANGCNRMLLDRNVVPQATLCTTIGCGTGFEDANDTRGIDADMMEVDNGGNASGWTGTKATRRDWMSLMNQGVQVGKSGSRHPLWATGVSDTHRLIAELPGYSRTFVQTGVDAPGSLNIKTFNQNVLGGNMYLSTGPIMDVTAYASGPTVGLGGTLDASLGTVNVNIEVQAAPWIPVEEVRVIKNGCVVACYNSSTSPAVQNDPPADRFDQDNSAVVRFSSTYTDSSVTADSYYVVEASGNLPGSGNPSVDTYVNRVAAGAFPFAMTNPVFADYDGGGYGGTGVAQPACGALPPSCSAGAAVVSVPAATMFARNDVGKELGLLQRILAALIPSASAHEAEERPDDEAERLRQHEETIRKAGTEYFPRQFFSLPTPAPQPAPAEKTESK